MENKTPTSPRLPMPDANAIGRGQMPHSPDAERAVLGSVLLNNASFIEVADVIEASDFHSDAHRIIFTAMRDLFNRGAAIDELTLSEALKRSGDLDRLGGSSAISDLLRYVASSKNVRQYAEIVKEKATTRRLITAGLSIAATGYDEPDLDAYLEDAERQIYDIAVHNAAQGFSTLKDASNELLKDIERRNLSSEAITGVPSGFRRLDDLTAGFQNGDLTIIAARPSMGKTALALCMALNAARHFHHEHQARIAAGDAKARAKQVAVFSLEMSREQLAGRLLCASAFVDMSRLRSTGRNPLTVDEWERITDALNTLNDYPIVMDDTSTITVDTIRSRCRKLAIEKGLGLVVVDYLQLMDIPKGRRNDNRAQLLGEISRGLKIMAKDLQVPVIALSQLNRDLEKRDDKRPRMSDLRESGAIEQDADLILFLYRDAVYHRNPEVLPVEKQRESEVNIAKQRNGPTGLVRLDFIAQFAAFVPTGGMDE